MLRPQIIIIVCIYDPFENNFRIDYETEDYFKESCRPSYDQHFSLKYFLFLSAMCMDRLSLEGHLPSMEFTIKASQVPTFPRDSSNKISKTTYLLTLV